MVLEIVRAKPDIVLTINARSATSLFCYWAKKIGKFPLIIMPCLHTMDDWAQNPLIYKIMKCADKIIALTDFEKKFIVSKGISESKISVIGPGIAPEKFAVGEREKEKNEYRFKGGPVVAYIGRFVKSKRIESLIDAMDIVWESTPDAQLLMAGDAESEYAEILKNKISRLSVMRMENVHFIENFDDKAKSAIFDALDIFVLPSISESFGIVILEAWARGKPCIVCKDSASAFVVEDGKDGLLFEFGNPQELAGAIKKLLSNESLRKELGENGRQKVLAEYTWDVIMRKIQAEYSNLVELA
jgi:glycosyltransferase involved in cell wall biosynthesis